MADTLPKMLAYIRAGDTPKHSVSSSWQCYSQGQVKVKVTSDQHDTDGEDLLRVGVWGNVAKADTGETAEGEVQSCDIFVPDGRARAQ